MTEPILFEWEERLSRHNLWLWMIWGEDEDEKILS